MFSQQREGRRAGRQSEAPGMKELGKEAQTRMRPGEQACLPPAHPLEEPPWPESPSRRGGAYPFSARDSPGGSKEPLSPQPLALLPALPRTWANHCKGSLSPPVTWKHRLTDLATRFTVRFKCSLA